jgi:uncharacterized protein YndB with AHSA1/START domain
MPGDGKNTHAKEFPAGINERAPVVGASEIEISATPEAVWEVLTSFERWPSWERGRQVDVRRGTRSSPPRSSSPATAD